MKKSTVLCFLIIFMIFILQSCKSKPIIPEKIKFLKSINYSKVMESIEFGNFENDKKIEDRMFSELVKNAFKQEGFVFKTDLAKFILNGKLLNFYKGEKSDCIYTDVNGTSVLIEDTNTFYKISLELFIVDKLKKEKIWSCMVSEESETDYPVSFITKMIKACIKTIKNKKTGEKK